MIGKIQGNIVDMLYAPLSALEVSMAIILAAIARSFLIAIISIVVFSLIVEMHINNIFYIIIFWIFKFIYFRKFRFYSWSLGRKI